MNIIIFGPPGAGKALNQILFKKRFNLFQLSTGEVLRKEIKNKTELSKKFHQLLILDHLVSDEIVKELIENFISDIQNIKIE